MWQAYKRRAAAAERDAEAAIADVQRVADERLAAAGKRNEKVPEVCVRVCVGVCGGVGGWWCRDTHMGGILCPQQLKKKMKEAAEKAKKDRDALSSALERTRYNNYSHLAVIYRHNARPVCVPTHAPSLSLSTEPSLTSNAVYSSPSQVSLPCLCSALSLLPCAPQALHPRRCHHHHPQRTHTTVDECQLLCSVG